MQTLNLYIFNLEFAHFNSRKQNHYLLDITAINCFRIFSYATLPQSDKLIYHLKKKSKTNTVYLLVTHGL